MYKSQNLRYCKFTGSLPSAISRAGVLRRVPDLALRRAPQDWQDPSHLRRRLLLRPPPLLPGRAHLLLRVLVRDGAQGPHRHARQTLRRVPGRRTAVWTSKIIWSLHKIQFAMISRYVLKLVIVVLTGIGLSTEKDDVIFALSMATSFGALIYFGLKASTLY